MCSYTYLCVCVCIGVCVLINTHACALMLLGYNCVWDTCSHMFSSPVSSINGISIMDTNIRTPESAVRFTNMVESCFNLLLNKWRLLWRCLLYSNEIRVCDASRSFINQWSTMPIFYNFYFQKDFSGALTNVNLTFRGHIQWSENIIYQGSFIHLNLKNKNINMQILFLYIYI